MFIIMGCLIPGDASIVKVRCTPIFAIASGTVLMCVLCLQGSVFGMFLYLVFFGFTWLELPWLYPAEINPLRTRTNANSVSTICNWSFNFGVVMATPPLLTAINWGTFLIFGVLNVLFIPFIWIYYPETAGEHNPASKLVGRLTKSSPFPARSLEEIDIVFGVAYHEKRSYVEVAQNMPSLSYAEIESEAKRLGLDGVISLDSKAERA